MAGKILGIIGGMGPEATVDFMDKIIKTTPAGDDCDHIRMLVDNNPQIPSRVQAILGSGESPAPVLVQMARNLEKWGADFLAIPCNTAHLYYSDIKNAVKIPVLNMVKSARKRILSELPDIKKIGLLASTAVVVTRLYHDVFKEDNIELITPDEKQQQMVMAIIFAVKANQWTNKQLQDLQKLINELIARGAEAILFACTELSVIAKGIQDFGVPAFDAAQILAEEVVHIVKG
ncbi:Aspartate racemase [Moorella glycerini]|uniref:Amino-acid racemase n=1 Tax=Neomoorella stamsii TaxID=1266720 RepID=A0A9X7J1T2_9FIRM|nr:MULTISPECIES: amino acid racemase [Moorella]PRR71886.1 putative amino-acid racemase [Moorella stamsii]CEP66104.1 Aspartate racemase [Moorella glycerini]